MPKKQSVKSVSVVVPVYNERQVIDTFFGQLKRSLKGKSNEIVVVNDGSDDGSEKVLRKHKGIKLISHSTNRGYGEAIKTGVKNSTNENIAIIDCDGTYCPEDLVKLIEKFKNQTMLIGARSVKGFGEPIIKKLMKKFLSRLAGYLTGEKISDLNSGLRIFKKDDFLRFCYLLPSGFSLTSTLTMAFLINGYPLEFLPISYYPRIGRSKINPFKDVFNFLLLILTTIIYFNPLRVFIPVSLFFFGLSLVVGLGSMIFLPKFLDTTTVILFVTGFQIFSIGILADMICKKHYSDWLEK